MSEQLVGDAVEALTNVPTWRHLSSLLANIQFHNTSVLESAKLRDVAERFRQYVEPGSSALFEELLVSFSNESDALGCMTNIT